MNFSLVPPCSCNQLHITFTGLKRFNGLQKCSIQSSDEFNIYPFVVKKGFSSAACKNKLMQEFNKDEAFLKKYCKTGANAKSHIVDSTDKFIVYKQFFIFLKICFRYIFHWIYIMIIKAILRH